MTDTTITIAGANEASYKDSKKESTRFIEFPDGLARSITLENRYWKNYDSESKHPRFRKTSFEELVFNHAQIQCGIAEPPEGFLKRLACNVPEDFEWILRECFASNIRASLTLKKEREFRTGNENRT